MFEAVTVPRKGAALASSWGASVATAVNALAPMAAPGGLCRSGVTGTGVMTLPKNMRDGVAATMAQPFDLKYVFDADGNATGVKVVNCFYNVGGVTFYSSDVVLEEFTEPESDGFLCVRFNKDTKNAENAPLGGSFQELELFFVSGTTGDDTTGDGTTGDGQAKDAQVDFGKLRDEQKDMENYVVALYYYKVTTDENDCKHVTTFDLRNMPQIQSFESFDA